MNKKKVITKTSTQEKQEKDKKKVVAINNCLIALRKNQLYFKSNNTRLSNKLSHFNKMFKYQIKNDDKVNYISYHLFQDKIDYSK
jgi:hypothetical protein